MSNAPRASRVPFVAAVAATTVAIGVTAASLTGWLRPPAAPAVAEPIAASAPAAVEPPAPPPEPVVAAHHHGEEHDDDDD